MTLLEQERIANELLEFLAKSGLKAKFVAGKIGMSRQTLSKFANHRYALSINQLSALQRFMDEYRQRNGI